MTCACCPLCAELTCPKSLCPQCPSTSSPFPTPHSGKLKTGNFLDILSNLVNKESRTIFLVTESKLLIWCLKPYSTKISFIKSYWNHASRGHFFPRYFVFSLSNLPFSRQTQWKVSSSPVAQSNSIEIRYSDFICRKSKSRADRVRQLQEGPILSSPVRTQPHQSRYFFKIDGEFLKIVTASMK